jgi:hypothetical protein
VKSVFLAVSVFLFAATSAAQNRFAFLCGAEHAMFPEKFQTEFHLVIDVSTVTEIDGFTLVDVYLASTPNSLLPKSGFSALATLEVTRLKKYGEKIWIDVKAAQQLVGNSKISFQTIGLELTEGANKISLGSADVDGRSLSNGVCVRKPDQDSLWP